MKGHHKMKFSHRTPSRNRGARGFSLLEMMIVCLRDDDRRRNWFHGGAAGAERRQGQSSFQECMMPLRVARQRAIAERKQYIVCFGLAAPAWRSYAAGRAHRAKHPDFPLGCGHGALRSHANHHHSHCPRHPVPDHRWVAEWCSHRAGWIWQCHGVASILIRMSRAAGSRTRSCSCPMVRRMTSMET